ncbi:hypothetical protein PM082_004443 [Marasmius tenuissimus]|nr:hypothetical protein PM082_004443 [Marasmius tenuissimus]
MPSARFTILVLAAISLANAAPIIPGEQALPAMTNPLGPNIPVTGNSDPLGLSEVLQEPRALPVVGDLLGGLGGEKGGKLPLVGDLTKSLPIVGGLGTRDSQHSHALPIVGDLLGGLGGEGGEAKLPLVGDLTKSLPIVGGLGVRDSQHSRALPIVGDLLGGLGGEGGGKLPLVGDLTKSLPIVSGLGVRDLQQSRALPVVGNLLGSLGGGDAGGKLPLVGDLAKSVPVVSNLGARHGQPGDEDGPPADNSKSDACGPCNAKNIASDALAQLTPLLHQITSMTSGGNMDIGTLTPLVTQVDGILGSATGKISGLVNAQGSGSVSVGDVANVVSPLVNAVLTSFGGVLKAGGNGDVKAITDLLSGPAGKLGGFLNSFTTVLGGDFTSSILPQITGNLGFISQLGGNASGSFNFLGLNLNSLLGKITGSV